MDSGKPESPTASSKKTIANRQIKAELKRAKDVQTFLSNIAEHAADAIIGMDLDTNILSWNRGAEMLFGYSAGEMIGKPWSVVIPKERVNECRERFKKATLEGFVKNIETIRVAKGGGRFPAEITLTALMDAGGEHIGFVSIIRDITERKLAEEKLHEAYENYDALINSIDGIVWEADPNTLQFSFVGRQAERILGYPIRQWLNEPRFCIDHIHPDDRKGIIKYCSNAVAEKRSHTLEYRALRSDGRVVWIRNIVTIVLKDGEPVKLRGVMIDITEHRELENKLRQAQKMEAVGHLAGGIAHDFTNALTVIVGFASLLQLKIEKENPLRGYVEQILAVSNRASNLTRSLLTFSRRQILNPRPVILHNIIETTTSLLTRIIREDIEIKTMPAENPLTIMADAGQIEQVLINLASNAQDAMPNGGSLTIETAAAEIDEGFTRSHGYGKTGAYALITVSDTGIGMDEKTRERVFEPFFTTKEVGKGTGLGLAMAYGIIKEHNGYIIVYSEVGKGTTFKIYLPLIKTDVEERQAEDIAPAKGTETILLAEDDGNVRDLIKNVLTEHGYKVIEAVNGDDAIERFRENKEAIQLALLDIIMPRKSGIEVYNNIKKITSDIKALFMSGYTADFVKKREAMEEGLNFIFKPVSPLELLKKIREILSS